MSQLSHPSPSIIITGSPLPPINSRLVGSPLNTSIATIITTVPTASTIVTAIAIVAIVPIASTIFATIAIIGLVMLALLSVESLVPECVDRRSMETLNKVHYILFHGG
ncbi:hypothetical protein FACUT_2804 [Fusarium acutatum]|uniref:Transmembrane protein n=1 Tax=Fusarium acutatum TaxID=78861 RepID=A0A8H4NXE4_9HYPO|nr:hypothetical protein FACUT_2804 [Fusarium acutatum]